MHIVTLLSTECETGHHHTPSLNKSLLSSPRIAVDLALRIVRLVLGDSGESLQEPVEHGRMDQGGGAALAVLGAT
jgi:hypothetical protein